MRILVTGGAGFIGTHTCVALAKQGFEPVVLDNLCNSSRLAVERASAIVHQSIPLVEADVRDHAAVADTLKRFDVRGVIHFAALKAVGTSVATPLEYFDNNVGGTISVLEAMRQTDVHDLVFSSSATVYGLARHVPVCERDPTGVTNPYGRTKVMAEEMIADLAAAWAGFGALVLRYFNPIGAHPSGTIGEDPHGVPENLMPFITQVAIGRRDTLHVFGGDWPTPDGTGVRDYIHVMDLARAHVAALLHLAAGHCGVTTLNVGTGTGTSVLELVRAFERVSGQRIPLEIVGRRSGDVAALWADVSLAQQVLGWHSEYGIDRMCADAWRWQSQNPNGYSPPPGRT